MEIKSVRFSCKKVIFLGLNKVLCAIEYHTNMTLYRYKSATLTATPPLKGAEKVAVVTGLEPVYTLLKSVGFLQVTIVMLTIIDG